MSLKKSANEGVLNLTISDRIDTATVSLLEWKLKNSFEKIESLVLNFAEVSYISSAGLGVLVTAYKVMSMEGGMKLINVGEPIMEIFKLTGFNNILKIE